MTATGNNYAEALFMLAREENQVDAFYDGLKIAKDVFDENPDYLRFLATPSIAKSERTSAIATAFGGKINEHVLSFLQLLCEHGAVEQFFDCIAEYERLREWASGSVEAVVKSAVKLSDTQKADLTKALEKRTGKLVTLKCVIDTNLIGGIVVELDGEMLDGSVKNNLKRAREVISV